MPHLPDILRTGRGSRPGSPLADALFHALMTEVHSQMKELLASIPAVAQGFDTAGVQPNSILWADDLALPFLVPTNADLVPSLITLTQSVHAAFEQRGLILNMARNKTTAVLSFRGPDAPSHRKQHLLKTAPGCAIHLSDGRQLWLHFACHYKHLGAMYVADGQADFEARARLGQAYSAYQSMKKPLFGNRAVSIKTRLRLLDALIMTKLFYGLSSRTSLSPLVMRQIESFCFRAYRYICGVPLTGGVTNDELRQQWHLPSFSQRLAVARLAYASKVWAVGPSSLQDVLQREDEVSSTSWWAFVTADLQWCYDVGFLVQISNLRLWRPTGSFMIEPGKL